MAGDRWVDREISEEEREAMRNGFPTGAYRKAAWYWTATFWLAVVTVLVQLVVVGCQVVLAQDRAALQQRLEVLERRVLELEAASVPRESPQ